MCAIVYFAVLLLSAKNCINDIWGIKILHLASSDYFVSFLHFPLDNIIVALGVLRLKSAFLSLCYVILNYVPFLLTKTTQNSSPSWVFTTFKILHNINEKQLNIWTLQVQSLKDSQYSAWLWWIKLCFWHDCSDKLKWFLSHWYCSLNSQKSRECLILVQVEFSHIFHGTSLISVTVTMPGVFYANSWFFPLLAF